MPHFHAGACKQGQEHDQAHGARCFNTMDEATRDMLQQVGRVAHDTEMGCDRDGCGCCNWCLAARALYRFFGKPFRNISAAEVLMNGHTEWDLTTPCEVVEIWMEQVNHGYETCSLRQRVVA